MGGGLKDAVSHGTKVKSDDKLNDYKQEEHFCPCPCKVSESMVKENEEEGDFNQ